MRARNHPQQLVTVDGRSAEVDVGLAPLIEALWRLGIHTQFSCQGSRYACSAPNDPSDWGQILFPDVEDLRRFMDLFGGTALSHRRFHISRWTAVDDDDAATRWRSRILVEPEGAFGGGSRPPDGGGTDRATDRIRIRAEVRFPPRDIAAMTRVVVTTAEATTTSR